MSERTAPPAFAQALFRLTAERDAALKEVERLKAENARMSGGWVLNRALDGDKKIATLTARLEAAEAAEITDDMMQRAAKAYIAAGNEQLSGAGLRAAIRDALTPPATETPE
jgi:hypothetical protein